MLEKVKIDISDKIDSDESFNIYFWRYIFKLQDTLIESEIKRIHFNGNSLNVLRLISNVHEGLVKIC